MSLAPLPYRVRIIRGTAAKDITDSIASLDSVKFQGTGKIRTASLMLDATDGAFITNEDFLGNQRTPILRQFDELEIRIQDDAGRTRLMRAEIDQELGQKNTNGNLLPLELKGRERALQDIKFTGYYQFRTPRFVLDDLRRRYNRAKGADQPTLRYGDMVSVPNTIVNDYDFTQETSFYDAILHVITRLNQPTTSGGAGDYYSFSFADAEALTSEDRLTMRVHVQGNIGTEITLRSTEADPFRSLTYQRHSQSGTQIFVRGTPNAGSVPVDFHRFQSVIEEINHFLPYAPTEVYPIGIVCRGTDNRMYASIQAVPINNPPVSSPSYWHAIVPQTILGSIQYSPWTVNKEAVWKNSCSNATNGFNAAGFDSPAYPDGNMVVREGFNSTTGRYVFYRNFAHLRTNSTANLTSNTAFRAYTLRNIGAGGIYNGFRVLVDTSLGAAGGSWTGTDKFGRTYADSLVIFDGTDWIVLRHPEIPDQVVILQEGRTYEWNVPLEDRNEVAQSHVKPRLSFSPEASAGFRGDPAGPRAWRDVTDTAWGNDVFHHPSNIECVPGLITADINGDDYTPYVQDSAIRITYDYDLVQEWIDIGTRIGEGVIDYAVSFVNFIATGLGFDEVIQPSPEEIACTRTTNFYEFGWWAALPFPLPFNNLNGIIENVGALYGEASPTRSGTQMDFAALDIQNANYSHSGNDGFNHDQASDLGGPFTGIRFYFNFDVRAGSVRKPFTGNVPFIVTVYDDLSQVWRTDFIYRFLGETQTIEIPFSSFTVDRPSRRPWGVASVFSNIIVPELEHRSIFEPKRVRMITIQTADSYDEHLRYFPLSFTNILTALYGQGRVTFTGIIDGLHLTKQPFVTSGMEPDRVINTPTIQAPNVRNLRQLESIAIAYRDVHALQFEEYTLQQDGQCDTDIEQYVLLRDEDLIDAAETANNTRRLVTMCDDFSYVTQGQKAGLILERTLVRRLPV